MASSSVVPSLAIVLPTRRFKCGPYVGRWGQPGGAYDGFLPLDQVVADLFVGERAGRGRVGSGSVLG